MASERNGSSSRSLKLADGPLPGLRMAWKPIVAPLAIGDALRMEEGHRGIKVMNVFPGTTRSNFGDNRLGARGRQAHQRFPPVTAEKVAKRIANAVERNQRSVYISWFPDRAAVAANWLAGWAISAVLRNWARRAQD